MFAIAVIVLVLFCHSAGLGKDPLSPYLFFIVVEGLSALLHSFETRGQIHGVKVNNRAPSISHLFFADGAFYNMSLWTGDCPSYVSSLSFYSWLLGVDGGKPDINNLGEWFDVFRNIGDRTQIHQAIMITWEIWNARNRLLWQHQIVNPYTVLLKAEQFQHEWQGAKLAPVGYNPPVHGLHGKW